MIQGPGFGLFLCSALALVAQVASADTPGMYSGNANNTQRQVISPVIRAGVDASRPLLSRAGGGGPQNFSCNVKVNLQNVSNVSQAFTVTLLPHYFKLGFTVGLGDTRLGQSIIGVPNWLYAVDMNPAGPGHRANVPLIVLPPLQDTKISMAGGVQNWDTGTIAALAQTEVEFVMGCAANQSNSPNPCAPTGFTSGQTSDAYWTLSKYRLAGSAPVTDIPPGCGSFFRPCPITIFWNFGSPWANPNSIGNLDSAVDTSAPNCFISGAICSLSGEANFAIRVGASAQQGAVVGSVSTHCSVMWGYSANHEVVTPLAGGHPF